VPRTVGKHQRQDNEIASRSTCILLDKCGAGKKTGARPRAWLINRTRITKGAAVGYTAWVRRAAAHPEVAAVLASGEMSESFARTICAWNKDKTKVLYSHGPPVRPG
jgi:hypothetical protein